jgi:uncharacterized protein (DUF983 family)
MTDDIATCRRWDGMTCFRCGEGELRHLSAQAYECTYCGDHTDFGSRAVVE